MSQTPHNSDGELLQTYDEHTGQPNGQTERSEIYSEPRRYYHGIATVFVVNQKGELLCSKRSDHVRGNPGNWQTFFGGHVAAGDSFILTAQRELAEEIGVEVGLDELHLLSSGKSEQWRHFYESYAYIYQGESILTKDGEISETKWLSFEVYNEAKDAALEQWCNGCSPEHQARIQQLLVAR